MSQSPVYLLMAIHCHQPVGNFGFVFEEAFRKAYEPFLAALERHPGVHVSLHYSGSLLDWLIEHQPQFLKRLTRLVKRGQVELLASGYYEPILPLISEADRQGQIELMRTTVQDLHGGAKPSGLWLTERVWEPELPQTLARAGIRYTMLDTNQFHPAKDLLPNQLQIEDEQGWDLLGCYTTEYAGSSIVLFPASKRLRYSMPFQDVSATIEFLRRLTRPEPVAITFADDGEKFGLWPTTYEWVYEQGWLERFFSALERESSWLATATFSRYLESVGTNGRVYLPCGSYEEMLEWSKGHFRNFFLRYPEANAMHQKMLSVSHRLDGLKTQDTRLKGKDKNPPVKRREQLVQRAERELYQAQCNCAYWHGVFGGLYLSHLRRAVYHHLITAERLIQETVRRVVPLERADVDGDGRMEVILRNRLLAVSVDPEEGGTVTEVDAYAAAVNLTDTLTRRYEPYHEKLKAKHPAPLINGGGQAPASIHELVDVKEEGLETFLAYDDHRRTGFIDYALSAMPTLQDVVRSTWGEHRLWAGGSWEVAQDAARRPETNRTALALHRRVHDGWLRKTVALWRDQPRLSFRYQIADLEIPVVGLEFNLGLCDPQRSTAQWQDEVGSVQIVDQALGIALTMTSDPPATLVTFPIETVSGSEEGLERTVQGLAVVWLWSTRQARRWAGQVEWTLEGAS